MNSKENLRSRFLQLMTEKVKSALLPLMVDNNEATSSILADPYGKLSHKTLDIIMSALTPRMLQHLKQDINAWVNEELSPPVHGTDIMHGSKNEDFQFIITKVQRTETASLPSGIRQKTT